MGALLFLLYTSELFSILQNKLIGYADDSTSMAVVPSLGIRVPVAESLIRDLGSVSEWCDLWRMKLNVSKTKTMIVSRSHTIIIIIIIIIILLKQDYKIQLTNNKIQMAWLTS